MVKHNNVLPNQHFRKYWARNVVTWFNQPARKERRRANRQDKARRLAPRPVDYLRPVVRCPTNKYNCKVKAGRGFTAAELSAAGIRRKEALTIGISIDKRRKNRSQEGFQLNVERLKLYKSKLVIFPRHGSKTKNGDSSEAELANATQVSTSATFPAVAPVQRAKARKITKAEREQESVVRVLRRELLDSKLWSKREIRARQKEEERIEAAKKAGKKLK